MAMMTVRNIPDAVHNALKQRAKRNNRSAEAEVRAILEAATLPEKRLQLGDALSALGKNAGLTNADFEGLVRKESEPAQPLNFE